MYLQDSWKVNRKLTLDYGLRWDYGTYQREQFGRYGDFSSTVPNPSASGRLGALIYEANCNCNFAHNYPYAIGPRLGAAYQIDSNTVIRGGVGLVYGSLDGSFATGFRQMPPAPRRPRSGRLPDCSRTAYPPAYKPHGRPLIIRPRVRLLEPSSARLPCSIRTRAAPCACCNGMSHVQRTLGRNLRCEAGYVGNRGVWETAGTSLGSAKQVESSNSGSPWSP